MKQTPQHIPPDSHSALQLELKRLPQKLTQGRYKFSTDTFSRFEANRLPIPSSPLRIGHLSAVFSVSKLAEARLLAASRNMSSPGFTSPFGANSNPFGSGRLHTGGMQNVIEEEENDTVASPTATTFGVEPPPTSRAVLSGAFGGDAASGGLSSRLRGPPNPESYPAQYNFARRTSVSAESLKPVADTYDNWSPPVHPKTPEQIERLKKAIGGNFLFSHLDDEQSAQILGALVEKPIPTKDIKVSHVRWSAPADVAPTCHVRLCAEPLHAGYYPR